MNPSGFSVKRPVFTTMVMLIVVILGAFSLLRLPIDLMPEVEYPTLTVSTNYENASPEEMEELITRRVEEAVAAVPGVDEMTSNSAEGISNVRVSFVWGTNLDAAASDVRERIDRILPRLPDDADRPQLRRFDPSSFPILLFGVSSRLDPIELRTLIDDQLKHRLERVPGVAVVDVWGGLEREIQVNLDFDRIRALQLPLDQVLDAIREANVNVPAGSIERGLFDVTLRTPGEFTDLDEVRETVVAVRDGATIRLGQIATIDDTHERISQIIRINGEPGVRLAVRKQSGTNTVEVAEQVKREAERINRDFPQLNLMPIIDQSEYIERSIANLGRTILYGGALAILVLLFFLRNVRSTFIIAVAIPISIVATFALVYAGGFTLNLMTLGGLALGVGMMVDNAIVVLESIYRSRERDGLDGPRAAVEGTGQVSSAVIASTITTLVIFLPLVFVEGITGMMFKPLAYVVGFALICSLGVALTMVPMIASRMLRPIGSSGFAQTKLVHGVIEGAGWLFDELEHAYRDVLALVLRFRLLTLGFALAAFAASLLLVPKLGAEFLPPTDEAEVRVNAEMEVGTRLDVIDRQMRKIEAIVDREVPEVAGSVLRIGASSYRPGSGATGELRLSLVPANERERSSGDIADDLRDKLEGIAGATIRTREGQGLFLLRMGTGGGEALELEVRGYDLDTLDQLASAVSDAIEDVEGVTDVRLSREAGVPQELFRIDRDRAADLGVSVSRLARTLETAIAGSRAGEFRDAGREVTMRVRLRDSEHLELDEILDLLITNNQGEQVVLRNMVSLEAERGPIQIERKNQQRIATVSVNISGRDLGSVAADVRERLRDVPVPANYEVLIGGDYEDQQEAFRELLLSLVLALLLVYMVMACLYESLRDPLIVMFSVPLATIGVVVMLFITETTFNVQSFIGCIMLGGIVVNNAILIVDQATRLRRDRDLATREAVMEAASRRFRPILMTSLTTILALLPLSLGWGEGAEAQAPLARAVIGGLISATAITLLVIPAVYSLFHGARRPEPVDESQAAG